MSIVCFTEIQPEKEKWKSFLVALLLRKVNGKQWKGKSGRINWDCLQQGACCHIKHPSHGFWTDFNCIFWMHSFWGDNIIGSVWKKWTCLLGKSTAFHKENKKNLLLYVAYCCCILMNIWINNQNSKSKTWSHTLDLHTHTHKNSTSETFCYFRLVTCH